MDKFKNIIDDKIIALALHLEYSQEEAERIKDNSNNYYEDGEKEFIILTDEEADEVLKDYIEQFLWSFTPNFLKGFMPDGTQDEAETILKPLQEKCENGNEAIKALCNWNEQADEIVEEAEKWDGRGHFLGGYDGLEKRQEVDGVAYYIYRTN